MKTTTLFLFALMATTAPAYAQGQTANGDQRYWSGWFDRPDRAKAEQPHWITPLATTTPRLEQEFRYDLAWQRELDGTRSENYGNGKGLELIPFDKMEVIFGVPPYLVHNQSDVQDGFGDVRVLVKYRLLSANEQTGNYIMTAFMDVSFPTGSGSNGATNAVVTPTLAYGKGLGRFDVQGTFGVAFPTGHVNVIGRTYIWNNAVQYQLWRRLWPELEVNGTFFQDGKNDGKKQVLVTPGLVVGRFPLSQRVALTIGAGLQVALSQFRTSTHNLILSVRLPF